MGLFRRQAREREQRDKLLSAYLDDQLSAGERERLEARLKSDVELQAELRALRHAVSLLRDLPPVPIPHNFILPETMEARQRPEPVARARRAWAAPLLTAATAVISLLFVIVLTGDLLVPGWGGLASAPGALAPAEAPQRALEASPVGEEVEVERAVMPTTTPPPADAALEAPPASTGEVERYAVGAPKAGEATGGAMGGGGPTDEAAVPLPTEEGVVAATAPTTGTLVSEKGASGAEPTPSEVAEAAPAVVGGREARTPEGEGGVAEDEGVGAAPVLMWRALEVVLGLTTFGLALITIRAWRGRRR